MGRKDDGHIVIALLVVMVETTVASVDETNSLFTEYAYVLFGIGMPMNKSYGAYGYDFPRIFTLIFLEPSSVNVISPKTAVYWYTFNVIRLLRYVCLNK